MVGELMPFGGNALRKLRLCRQLRADGEERATHPLLCQRCQHRFSSVRQRRVVKSQRHLRPRTIAATDEIANQLKTAGVHQPISRRQRDQAGEDGEGFAITTGVHGLLRGLAIYIHDERSGVCKWRGASLMAAALPAPAATPASCRDAHNRRRSCRLSAGGHNAAPHPPAPST